MLHDPAIVFLDEPTIGMDAVAKERCREFLSRQVRDRGRTIVLTTHDMTEVAKLCERVLLINHGRLVFDGTVDELKRRHGGQRRVRVTFSGPVEAPTVPGARILAHDGLEATLVADGTSTTEDVLHALVSRCPIATVSIEETDLEDLIREVYLGGVSGVSATAAVE
jgi:viologen exporter family transport system ATP-binding protein